MGSADTIRQLEKELLALRKRLEDSKELDELKDLAAALSKENKSLKAKNKKLSSKISALEDSLKAVDTAVDKALDDE